MSVMTAAPEMKVVTEASRLVMPRYAKLRFDKTRDRWVILVPERVLVPDETAVEILQLCDGTRTVGDVIDVLAQKYIADRATIAGDVIPMLQELVGKSFLTDLAEESHG